MRGEEIVQRVHGAVNNGGESIGRPRRLLQLIKDTDGASFDDVDLVAGAAQKTNRIWKFGFVLSRRSRFVIRDFRFLRR
jgi:hypothetical protein